MGIQRAPALRGSPVKETTRKGHLSIPQLGAYHRDQLTDDEQEALREHLLVCRECRQILLDLVEFLDGDPPPSRSSAEEVVTAWQELQRAVAEDPTRSSSS